MELKSPTKKGYKVPPFQSPLPICNDGSSSIYSDEYDWPFYTGQYNGTSVIIDDPVEIIALAHKGFFGKGSLSKGCPTVAKRKAPINVISESQWKRRKHWLNTLTALLQKGDYRPLKHSDHCETIKDSEESSSKVDSLDNKTNEAKKTFTEDFSIKDVPSDNKSNEEEKMSTEDSSTKDVPSDNKSNEEEKMSTEDSSIKDVSSDNKSNEEEKMSTEDSLTKGVPSDNKSNEEEKMSTEEPFSKDASSDQKTNEEEKMETEEYSSKDVSSVTKSIVMENNSKEKSANNVFPGSISILIEDNADEEASSKAVPSSIIPILIEDNSDEESYKDVPSDNIPILIEDNSDEESFPGTKTITIEDNSKEVSSSLDISSDTKTILIDDNSKEGVSSNVKSNIIDDNLKEKSKDVPSNNISILIEDNSDEESSSNIKSIRIKDNSKVVSPSNDISPDSKTILIEDNSKEELSSDDKSIAIEDNSKEVSSSVAVSSGTRTIDLEVNPKEESHSEEPSHDSISALTEENNLSSNDNKMDVDGNANVSEASNNIGGDRMSLDATEEVDSKNESPNKASELMSSSKSKSKISSRKITYTNEKLLQNNEVLVIADLESNLDDYTIKNLNPHIEKENIKTVVEVLYLSLEEAFFLSYALNCLQVIDLTSKCLSFKDMWIIFQQSQSDFIEKYVAYHHFRSKGWVVKSGIKYGSDFLLYKRGPLYYHASYIAIVQLLNPDGSKAKKGNSIEWTKISAMNRMSETAGKEILICQVMKPDLPEEKFLDPSVLKQFSVGEYLVRRWQPSHEKDNSPTKMTLLKLLPHSSGM